MVEDVAETARTTSIALDAVDWPGHLAGQHVDVRLTAEDGYQAQRSYSIASAPEDEHLVITVQRLDDGEVSPYLTETLVPGDELELRGPIGGYFVWREALGGPLLLVAGGAGVVPLRAILRHHRAVASEIPVRLLYSARTGADLIYRAELDGHDTIITLTDLSGGVVSWGSGGVAGFNVDARNVVAGKRRVVDIAVRCRRDAVRPATARRFPDLDVVRRGIDAAVIAALPGKPDATLLIERQCIEIRIAGIRWQRPLAHLMRFRIDADDRVLSAVGHPRCAIQSDDHAMRRRSGAQGNLVVAARSPIRQSSRPRSLIA